jgi:16S rRNA processing protein RimM
MSDSKSTGSKNMSPEGNAPDTNSRIRHAPEFITMGRVGAPYGVRGWVKVHSFTEQNTNLLEYDPWYFLLVPGSQGYAAPGGWTEAPVIEAREHGKGLVARFEACDDRDTAARFAGCEIGIRRNQLPRPEAGEYYWVDLQGLQVLTLGGKSLGVVDHLLATGANDVLVVKGERERLIPFVQGSIVRVVDLEGGTIRVDWDPDYD